MFSKKELYPMSNLNAIFDYTRTPNGARINMRSVKSIRSIIIIAVIAVMLLTGSIYFYNKYLDAHKRGNTAGNISNYGYVTTQGNWFYYSLTGQKGIYKMKSDGSEQIKICDDTASYINVIDDWIYYCNNNVNDYFNIYKIRTDGTDRINVNIEQSNFPNVIGNWIYYINVKDKSKPYKIQIDGNNKTKINDDDNSENIIADGDWLYYIKHEKTGEEKLIKVRTDGNSHTVLSGDKINQFCVTGDIIYYINSKDKKIYKMQTDGSNKTKLHNDEADSFNVTGNAIYYCNKSDAHKIYKINTDGSNNVLICDDQAANINIAGDWIYYLKNISTSQGKNTYRVRLDGKDKQETGIMPTNAPAK
jgi:hypothetical protein